MTVQDELGGVALWMVYYLIGAQVMWLFDVAADYWTNGEEGHEEFMYYISYMTQLKHTVTEDEDDNEDFL